MPRNASRLKNLTLSDSSLSTDSDNPTSSTFGNTSFFKVSSEINSSISSSDISYIETVASEVLINIFQFLPRNELDKCVLVNRRWKEIINIHQQKFARRCIEKISVYADFDPLRLSFWGCSLAGRAQITHVLDLNDKEKNQEIINILKHSRIKCFILSTINLTPEIIQRLLFIIQQADTVIAELQMRRIGLANISPALFHGFCETLGAKKFGFSNISNVQIGHFGNDFFNTNVFKNAKYLSIKGIASDEEEVNINVDDDVLLNFIFGINSETTDRKIACLDSPTISSKFVNKALNRFSSEPNINQFVTEVVLSSCNHQSISHFPKSENVILGYASWSSFNSVANKELLVEVRRETTGLFSIFFSISRPD